jgi:chemotaxis protein methyltransferase CheR
VKDEWLKQLEQKVLHRMNAVGIGEFAIYFRLLETSNGTAAELQELVEELLNHESQFNRSPEQLTLLKKEILAGWLQDPEPRLRRIASLGCSTGEEAYSLAIAAEQVLGQRADEAIILGLDVSRRAITAARQARYSSFRLRDVPVADRDRCFTGEGDSWTVRSRLRQRVRLLQHNLLAPLPATGLDALFCCNVLIYFPAEVTQRLLHQFHAALKPHGHLFLGHADSNVPRPDLFQPVYSSVARCYLRRPASEMNPAASQSIP